MRGEVREELEVGLGGEGRLLATRGLDACREVGVVRTQNRLLGWVCG